MFFIAILVFSLCFVCIAKFLSMSRNMWINVSALYIMPSTVLIHNYVQNYSVGILETLILVAIVISAIVYAEKVKINK